MSIFKNSQKKHTELRIRIQKNNENRRKLLEECIEFGGNDPLKFIEMGIPQSQLFMIEIIPYIHAYYESYPVNITKTALDIGPQTFGGTALLQQIHAKSSHNKLKLEVTAIDIRNNFELVQEILCPDIEFLVKDIFDINDKAWDTVICSHVIEHVPNPLRFLRQCQKLARDQVIVACPWNENPIVTNGHINTINKEFTRPAGAKDLKIYTNYFWGKQREVCIFRLDGQAE